MVLKKRKDKGSTAMTDKKIETDDEIRSIKETAERMASRLNLRFVINEEKVRSFAGEDESDTIPSERGGYPGPTLQM